MVEGRAPGKLWSRLRRHAQADAAELADFTYAGPSDGRLKRLAIRSIEGLTGKLRLRRLYLEFRDARALGTEENFWSSAVRRLDLHLDYDITRLEAIPETGPAIVVANHPYGVLDGLIVGHLVSQRRPDFRVLANGVLTRSPDAAEFILPIDFATTPEARATNLRSRQVAQDWVRNGGVLVVFPGGTVSTAPKPFESAVDPRWRPFTAKLIQLARGPVIPICFVGQNSRLFQIASHVSDTLRLSLLFHEVANKIGSRQRIEIGEPISYAQLAAIKDRQAVVDFLRERTYALHPDPTLGHRIYIERAA